MNHDATHCADYIPNQCPPTCYRGKLTQELIELVETPEYRDGLYSFAHFKETQNCPRWPKKMEEK